MTKIYTFQSLGIDITDLQEKRKRKNKKPIDFFEVVVRNDDEERSEDLIFIEKNSKTVKTKGFIYQVFREMSSGQSVFFLFQMTEEEKRNRKLLMQNIIVQQYGKAILHYQGMFPGTRFKSTLEMNELGETGLRIRKVPQDEDS